MFRFNSWRIFLLAVCLCKPLYADQGLLAQHRSAQPITALIGLPAASVRSDGMHVQLSIEHSNVFMGGASAAEKLMLDGETTALHARFSKRLNPCWQTDAALVYLSHNGGFLDTPIEDWHSVFGLPNASRELVETDKLEYSYQSGDDVVRQVVSNEQGFGDIQLSIQRFRACEQGAPIWRVGTKLGIASDDGFFGSGGTDFFIDWQSSRLKITQRFDGSWSVGLLALGKANNLPKQNSLVAFGSLGSEFHWSSSLSIVAQLDWHSPIFNSTLEELGRVSGQFTLLARKKLRGNALEVSLSEDIVTDTAPDFSVRLAWRQGL
ncbi:MAG: DUF3187 family protein [Granulosicoccaceae bacterium]